MKINFEINKEKMKSWSKVMTTSKFWIIVGAIGIWANFVHNVWFEKDQIQSVWVEGGGVNINRGNVTVSGTVGVDGPVDANIYSINGYRNCFYNSYSQHPNDYYRIPITN